MKKPKIKLLSGNKKKDSQIENIFFAGQHLDIVFNIDSSTPIVRAAIVHECRYASKEMIVSQTQPQILPSFREYQMDLTALVKEELDKKHRMGLSSQIIKFLKDYQLSDHVKEDAILVSYTPPAKKINIRAAFRLEPSAKLELQGKLTYKGVEFLCGQSYKIHDISNTGVGLIIPKTIGDKKNPLKSILVDESALIELDLLDFTKEDHRITISGEILVVRKNVDYNKKSEFIGTKFSSIDRDFEKVLSKFIHEAQLYERRATTNLS